MQPGSPFFCQGELSLALRVDAHCPVAMAEFLAKRLGIPLLGDDEPGDFSFLLHWRCQGLELRKSGDKKLPGALRVDFGDPGMLRRLVRCRQELVVRAAKISKQEGALLFDATAGLGRDGFLLAAAGFRVWMFERHPVIAALLRDGLERAARSPETAAIASRITLVEEDALFALAAPEEQPAVIYLDPMFPARPKSAEVKQNAQLLRHMNLGNLTEETALLQAALALQPKKVVIKRPLKGGKTAVSAPSYSIKGKSVRYEVYPAS